MYLVRWGTQKANELNIWVWRSLVACLNGVQEAGSSNLLTQTKTTIFEKRIVVFLYHQNGYSMNKIAMNA